VDGLLVVVQELMTDPMVLRQVVLEVVVELQEEVLELTQLVEEAVEILELVLWVRVVLVSL
jgi:hypothetical protein